MLRAIAVLIALLPAVALADMTGQASVIDGDTIEIHGQRIRLHGIHAPESGQFCMAAGQRWRCGQRAALALADKIGRRPVACAVRYRDHYGRDVATCHVSGEDLGAWLVASGWALASRRHSMAYIRHEDPPSKPPCAPTSSWTRASSTAAGAAGGWGGGALSSEPALTPAPGRRRRAKPSRLPQASSNEHPCPTCPA